MAGKNIRVKLTGVTLNNPSVFKKRATIEDGPEKYRTNISMDPTTKQGKKNIALLEEAIEEAKEAAEISGSIKEDRICLFDGNNVENDDGDPIAGYADMMICRATSSKRPKVVDRDGETPLTEEDDKIYGGVIVNVYVDVWGTKDKKFGGKGVFATLMGIQFVAEGERFGGAAGLGDDAFEDLGDSDDDEPKSKKKKRPSDDDDEEDEAPKSKKKKSRVVDEDDEDDEPKAKKKKRPSDDDDEDDEPKARKKKRPSDDDDEEDDEPKARKKSRRVIDEDDDEEV